MKNIKHLIFLFYLLPCFTLAQKTKHFNLTRLGFDRTEIVYTDESVLLYPRGFIYNVDEPDSVFYLGCLSSDKKLVTDYFENLSPFSKIPVGETILRMYENYTDSIEIESLANKIKHFKYLDNNNSFEINKTAKYILMYYWNDEVLDRSYIKNIKFFKKFTQNNPDKKIQVIAVSTKQP